MKMIIGVLFLGLVACAFGEPQMPSGCDNVNDKAQSNFDFSKFFTGQWHLTHAKRVSDPKVCETFTVNGMQITFTLGNVGVTCNLEKVNQAKFTKFNCKMGNKEFSAYLSVLATDYKNYALVYRCGSHESPTKANYQIAQRQKSQTFPTGLKSSLNSKGLKENDFKTYGCK